MATFQEYLKNKKRKQNIVGMSFSQYMKSKYGEAKVDDIAPVKTSDTDKEDDVWFKGGAFEDGYQTGDMLKTVGGTLGDAGIGILKGLTGLGEGIVDLGQYLVSGAADLVGADEFAKDVKKSAQKNFTEDFYKPAEDFVDKYSVLGDKADNITQGLGQVAGIILTGGAGSAAGLGTVGASALTMGTTFLSSTGGGMSEAYQSGASDEEAFKYGLLKGGIDAGSELLFGGLGKAANVTGLSKGIGGFDDILANKLFNKVKNDVAKNALKYGFKASGEGVEEAVAGYLTAHAKQVYSDDDIDKLLKDENLFEQFITGALVGGLASAPSLVQSTTSGRDYVSGLTSNEQKVVDAEVKRRIAEREKGGTKLSSKEKSAIMESVENELKKGGISTDTIESILNEKTHKNYQSIIEQEKALNKKIEEINNDTTLTDAQKSNLVKTVNSEIEALNKSQIEGQLMTEMDSLTQKDTYLRESYNEKGRRSETFKADLSKYDDKHKAVIQKAIDSGILNNTNKTHDFVDFVAKVSADTGTSFDFANNQKIQESGFALEGATVDGYVTKDGITLNVQSNKSLNTVVGHEITHVLEGTDLYDKLQNTIIKYAQTKGDYKAKMQRIQKLYTDEMIRKQYGKDADVEAIRNSELTADLVGEYLFTDSDFVTNLSAENPSLFKKIYEEIKHLLKLATAGSKEARQLEQVKRAFDKAYKQSNATTDSETRYSLEKTSDGTEYVKAESGIFVKKDGTLASEREVFNSLEGKTIHLADGDVKIVKNLPKKGMYNELFKRQPKTLKGVEGVKELNKNVNYHMEELLTNSTMKTDNVPDINGRHKEQNLTAFDTRTVKFYDGSKVYDVELSIGILENGEKVAYAKKFFGYDEETTKKIQTTETRGSSNTPMNQQSDNDIVPQNTKKSSGKVEFFISEDNKGRTLSKEQQEFFKNSKAVDADGRLLELYHGSTSTDTFTVFDTNMMGKNYKNPQLGKGFYFTTTKESAKKWAKGGKVFNVYLNMKKPFIVSDSMPVPQELLEVVENGSERVKELASKSTAGFMTWYGTKEGLLQNYGYDGIILKADENSDFYKIYGDQYVVFDSNQIKKTTAKKPTSSDDIRHSLSGNNEDIAPVGNYNVYGSDIALAPVREDVAPVQEVADDYAPLTEEMANERDAQLQNIDMLDGSYMPDEVEAPYYESNTEVDDPFEERDIKDVGDRKVNAYMYDNPEVKPYFQQEAQSMLWELQNSVKGEKHFNDQLYYDTSGEQGWFGTKRETSDDIAYLLDNFKYKYDDIEKGLRAIIQDHGAENNAISKRIEFALNDRLKDGYTDFMTGEHIPANQDYVNLLMEKQINSYSDDAYYEWVQTLANEEAPQPLESITDDIAPLREDIVPKVKENAEFEAIAQVLDAEPTTESTRNKRKWAIFKANILDKGSAFEDLSLKTGNRELMGKWNYTLYSESRAQRLIGSGDGNVKSLNAIREQVDNTGMTKQFYEYMYHKHNVDRMKLEERYGTENKPVFGESVTAEVSQEIVDKYEATQPKFMDYAQDVYDYQNYLRQQLVDNGVISQETAELWQEMYPHYVPVRRIDTTGYNINVPLDTRRTGVNAPIKKAVGGSSDILPLFDTMAMRTLQTYKATAKNSFGVELKNTLNTTVESSKTSVDDVIESVEAQDTLLKEGKNGKKPTFTVFENGDRVTFEITEDMYDALQPVSEALSKTIGIANKFGKIHRGVLTEFNPVFMLTNPIKDVQDILLNSQHAGKTYAKLAEALTQIKNKGYWYTEYMNNGGDQNSYFSSETNTFTEEKGKISNFLPFRAISTLNNYIETIPRLAEYIASREEGRSIEVSMLDSARVTTNFRAGGDVTKFLNRNGATFLNASVQGAMQQVRNFREAHAKGMKGWANLATKFAIAGIPALILNSLLWGDDEEYEELSDYVKQNYHIIGKDDNGNFIRIPKGRTVAVIQDAFKQMENAITGNDEVDLNSFLDLVVTNLAPTNPTENNILAPIGQVMTNTTWYGDDLVPERLQNLPDGEQYDETTDIFSVWLGQNLNVSPMKINYLLDQYTGGIGDVLLPMLTPAAESGDDNLIGAALAPIRGKFTTNSTTNNQNVADIYDLSDKLTKSANSSKATDEDILKNKYISSIKAEMSELSKQKREIQNSDLKQSKKYAQVTKIQEQITELAKEGLNSYEGVNIEGNYATVGDRYFKKNSDGEWEKITDKQLEKQNKVTSALDISASEYWSDKEWYDYSYESPEKAAIAKAVGGYDVYKPYAKALNTIKGDKDANGDTISGSRKPKVVEYINSIDADYGTKIILLKSAYPSDDRYNREIVEYLNNRDDISYSEMEEILKALGFNVDANGNISW